MRVFLYEFASGGGLWSWEAAHPATQTLLSEGASMVRSLAEDFLPNPRHGSHRAVRFAADDGGCAGLPADPGILGGRGAGRFR